MFNNLYSNLYNTQPSIDRINAQIQELENMKKQIQQPVQQPTNLTQNFQIAPSSQNSMRYANTIEDVNKEIIVGDTPFFSKDLSVVWIKNAKGEIKSYELTEIVLRDDKDIMIESLQKQINDLKGMIKNEHDADTDESVESQKSTSISNARTSTKKQK